MINVTVFAKLPVSKAHTEGAVEATAKSAFREVFSAFPDDFEVTLDDTLPKIKLEVEGVEIPIIIVALPGFSAGAHWLHLGRSLTRQFADLYRTTVGVLLTSQDNKKFLLIGSPEAFSGYYVVL